MIVLKDEAFRIVLLLLSKYRGLNNNKIVNCLDKFIKILSIWNNMKLK